MVSHDLPRSVVIEQITFDQRGLHSTPETERAMGRPSSPGTGFQIGNLRYFHFHLTERSRLLRTKERGENSMIFGRLLSPKYQNETSHTQLSTLELNKETINSFGGKVCLVRKMRLLGQRLFHRKITWKLRSVLCKIFYERLHFPYMERPLIRKNR